MKREKILCRVLTGPTASGKTELAMHLAEELDLAIICMDSMQIYRRLDIGTAKPSPEDRRKIPHYLFDICEPYEAFNVSLYRDLAEKTVAEITMEQGKEVLFVGGTGLYLSALLHPMDMGSAPADEYLREELRKVAVSDEGRKKLHDLLRKMDPESAERLPYNDVRRIIRAIEVTRTTGIPFSKQPKREKDSPFEWSVVSTYMCREELYRKINQRVDRMIKDGLFDEVKSLLNEGVPENAQSMQGLGYKEMIPCVKGICSIEDAAESIRIGTRHYAKRQETYLKKEKNTVYINTGEKDAYRKLRKHMIGEDVI